MLSVKLQILNKYYQIQSYIITFFFCILPISLIVGNLATNINILLIDILFIIISFNKKYWTWSRKKLFLILIILWIYQIINSVFSINIDEMIPYKIFRIYKICNIFLCNRFFLYSISKNSEKNIFILDYNIDGYII